MQYIGRIQQGLDLVNKAYVDSSIEALDGSLAIMDASIVSIDSSVDYLYGEFRGLDSSQLFVPVKTDSSIAFKSLNKGVDGQFLQVKGKTESSTWTYDWTSLDVAGAGDGKVIRNVSQANGLLQYTAEDTVHAIPASGDDSSIPDVSAVRGAINALDSSWKDILSSAMEWWGEAVSGVGGDNDLNLTIDGSSYHVVGAKTDSHPAWKSGDVIFINITVGSTNISREYVAKVLESGGLTTIEWQRLGDETSGVVSIGGLQGVVNTDASTLLIDSVNRKISVFVKDVLDGSGQTKLVIDDKYGGLYVTNNIYGNTVNVGNIDATSDTSFGTSSTIAHALQVLYNMASDSSSNEYYAKTCVADISVGEDNSWYVTHNLGTLDVVVSVYDQNNNQVLPDIGLSTNSSSENAVRISISSGLSAERRPSKLHVVIVGSVKHVEGTVTVITD